MFIWLLGWHIQIWPKTDAVWTGRPESGRPAYFWWNLGMRLYQSVIAINLWAESKMGLKQKIKKTCKSAPAWASGPHGPCILRFSLRLEIESNWDKISLDCFPSLRTINMYPMLFMKEERHHVSQTTTIGASPPLILWFHPSKRHAALIASRDQGSVVLAFTLVLLVLKHFWWRVILVILMFVAWL